MLRKLCNWILRRFGYDEPIFDLDRMRGARRALSVAVRRPEMLPCEVSHG